MANRAGLSRNDIDESDHSDMRMLARDHQLAEVIVERHQDATFLIRPGKDCRISGVPRPVADPDDIDAFGPQLVRDHGGHTGVEE